MPMPEPESESENLTYQRKAFYLPAASGQLFCLHYLPVNNVNSVSSVSSHVVFFPPFAEELNRSRHIMSLMAAQLAAKGFSVLLVDLFGTGDSEGDLIDAGWAIWKKDMLQAIDYLQQQKKLPVNFLTIRLGTLLALDILNECSDTLHINHFIAWQPVFNSNKYIKQFLKLQLANTILQGNKLIKTETIEEKIKRSGSLEIAGYPLSAALMEEILQLSRTNKFNLSTFNSLMLYQITPGSSTDFSTDIQSFMLDNKHFQDKIKVKLIQGKAFWQNYGIQTCAELMNQTLFALTETISDTISDTESSNE